MKKTGLIAIAFLLATGTAFAKQRNFAEITQVKPFFESKSYSKEDFQTEEMETTAFYCESGKEFPIRFLSSNKAISFHLDPNLMIAINSPFYFRIHNNKLYFSTDLKEWVKPHRFLGHQTFVISSK